MQESHRQQKIYNRKTFTVYDKINRIKCENVIKIQLLSKEALKINPNVKNRSQLIDRKQTHNKKIKSQIYYTVSGDAGQPRASAQRRPKPQVVNKDKTQDKQRNTSRGLRSMEALQIRNKKRSIKRNIARRNKRREKRGLPPLAFEAQDTSNNTRKNNTKGYRNREQKKREKEQGGKDKRHTLQEEGETVRKRVISLKMKMNQKKVLRVGTLNVNGIIEIAKREEIEQWMSKNKIHILCIQETHIRKETTEHRKQYTWYLGEADQETTVQRKTGVGIVINNEFKNYIEDIEVCNGRMMAVTLNANKLITIINVYAPTALDTLAKNRIL